jgi:hypothetical protein
MVIGRIFAGISRTVTSKYAKAIAKNTVPDTGDMNRIGPKRRTYPTRTRTAPYMQPKSKIAKLNTVDKHKLKIKGTGPRGGTTVNDRIINKKVNDNNNRNTKILKTDKTRIIKNKLPVKQRPIRTKTKPNYIIDKTKMTGKYPGLEAKKKIAGKYPGLEAKKKNAVLDWQLKEHEQKTMTGLRRQPASMVPDRLDREIKAPSMFEQTQKVKERPKNELNEFGFLNPLKEGKNKGVTKDGRFRNSISMKGEQSYDPDMAKKWTGVGLGVAGGGTLAWDQKKSKFPDPIKFG